MKLTRALIVSALLGTPLAAPAPAITCNLKVVTDASPDYSDLPSMIHSITSRWTTPEEKCWALFYWNHIARRQTQPMHLHGMALTDPIRQFNDYGYTMCSTVAGINCSLWDALGLNVRYWDISLHTVSEVEYGGRWHMYDNSMSALYTLCDGTTLAGVEDIGRPGGCAASGDRVEPGHIARYHCLCATSPRGFLTGADTLRDLDQEYRCFNPNGLKHRSYFHDWDRGHRYILNLREGEQYTRHYRSLGTTPAFYVPNLGKDPEAANERYRIRGNGVRLFRPALTRDGLAGALHESSNLRALEPAGLAPVRAGEPATAVFKVEGANVIASLKISASFHRRTAADVGRIEISACNGLSWREVWDAGRADTSQPVLSLVDEVGGAYEVLVRVTLLGQAAADDAGLLGIQFETITQLNSKTQPALRLGRNTVYVGAGDPLESIVFWPDLQGTNYRAWAVAETNVATRKEHPGYMGVLHAAKPGEPACVVFRIDAPRDIVRATYGGRLYNRAPRSHIDLLHSFDGGATWARSYGLTRTDPPWDVIHYETVSNVPPGTRSVLFKYVLDSPQAGADACSLYAVRMEANHRPAAASSAPLAVTFAWSERQQDYSLVERSHTERIDRLPHRYTIDVGGADHPVVRSLRIAGADVPPVEPPGYADGRDAGGEKFVDRWVTYGKVLTEGKPYTVSVPSGTNWGAGDPDGKKLTDGIVGPPYAGGAAPRTALLWDKGQNPEITVDMGATQKCGAFRIHIGAGWPWWDSLKGEVKDKVEVLTSLDGKEFVSRGFFGLNLRWKDLPANHFWPDDEKIQAHNFELACDAPADARYVRYRITPERTLTVSEVQALEFIKYESFDLRIALPEDN